MLLNLCKPHSKHLRRKITWGVGTRNPRLARLSSYSLRFMVAISVRMMPNGCVSGRAWFMLALLRSRDNFERICISHGVRRARNKAAMTLNSFLTSSSPLSRLLLAEEPLPRLTKVATQNNPSALGSVYLFSFFLGFRININESTVRHRHFIELSCLRRVDEVQLEPHSRKGCSQGWFIK